MLFSATNLPKVLLTPVVRRMTFEVSVELVIG
jgi:hypothetical protein